MERSYKAIIPETVKVEASDVTSMVTIRFTDSNEIDDTESHVTAMLFARDAKALYEALAETFAPDCGHCGEVSEAHWCADLTSTFDDDGDDPSAFNETENLVA
jgi:hypothetical protein